MPLDTQVPVWLREEIAWRRGIGDEGTKMVNNMVAIGGALLQQKGQREALAMQADEQGRMHQDMEEFPIWLQQHDGDPSGYVPKSRWGERTSAQAWQQKYQRGILDYKMDQADSLMSWRESQAELNKAKQENLVATDKAMIESDKRFLRGLDMVPNKRAEILGPEGKKGYFTADQWKRLDNALAAEGLELPAVIDYDTALAKSAGKGDAEPRTKKLDDGTVIAWMPGAKGLHIIKDGKKMELTPSQAGKLAEQPGISKTDREFFRQYSIAKGKSQTGGFEPAPTPAKPEEPKPSGLLDKITDWFKGSKTEPKPAASAAPATAPAAAAPSVAAPASHEEEADIAARTGTKSLPKVKNQADIDKAIKQANDALSNGADRDWVLNRLKELGVPVKE